MAILSYAIFFLTLACTYGMMTLGLNLQWGYAGLFNVGVAGFACLGAYATAFVTAAPDATHWGGFALPIAAGWLAAMATAAAAAAFTFWVTRRLRADTLAIVTFGAAASLQLVAQNAQGLTGGPFGIALIPRPFAALSDRPLAAGLATLALMATTLGVAYLALQRLTASPWGRVLRAIREDEVAAASLGKPPGRFRMQAFVIGAALIGLGGAMQAQFFGFVAPENFLPALTFLVWVMLVAGGAGNHRGALAGALVVWGLWTLSGTALAWLLPQALQARAASLRLVAIGLCLAGMLLARPKGLIGEEARVSRFIGK